MSSSFVFTPSATRDIDEILEYVLDRDGSGRALHVYEKLHDAFLTAAAQPNIGHRREDLADESLRVWLVYSFLVIYRPDTRPVEIVRVLHGARDIPSIL